MDDSQIQFEIIADDINDFFDENSLSQCADSADEITLAIEKLHELRSTYRYKAKEIQKSDPEVFQTKFAKEYDQRLEKMKDFIKEGNDRKQKIRMKDHITDQKKIFNTERQLKFCISDIYRHLSIIKAVFDTNFKTISNDELMKQHDELNNLKKNLNYISGKIPELLAINSSETDKIVSDYEKYTTMFTTYSTNLKAEIALREIEKETLFQEQKLNIKLGVYKGYDSEVDFYTFKSKFNKLYERTTPKRLMGELLKNNHLKDPALSIVSAVENIDEIWERLRDVYGDPKIMLNQQLVKLEKLDPSWKMKNPEKVSEQLTQIIAKMKNLLQLCKQHHIEAKLYHGDALEKIYKLIGDGRVTRWLSTSYNENYDEETTWYKLIEFLEKDVRIIQQKSLIWRKFDKSQPSSQPQLRSHFSHQASQYDQPLSSHSNHDNSLICFICNETDNHTPTTGPYGKKFIQYFSCKIFAEMHPNERFLHLRNKELCFQCLFPGASTSDKKHQEGRCQRDFVCQHPSHKKFPIKKHVLVCEEHKHYNAELLQQYKNRCILNQKVELQPFSKNIQLTFFTSSPSPLIMQKSTDLSSQQHSNDNDIKFNKAHHSRSYDQNGIFQLQVINVDGQAYLLFFDSGCGDFVSRRSAINKIGTRAKLEYKGPISIGGVANTITQSPHGIYSVKLPLNNGNFATMTGICLDEITATLPHYPLRDVEDEINHAFNKGINCTYHLPKLPSSIGGDVDFMIGIKYLRYHPQPVFQMPSGLTIYTSMFNNAEGGSGIIGGPHEIFTAINNQSQWREKCQYTTFFSNQLSIYENGFQVNPDVSILGYKEPTFDIQINDSNDQFKESTNAFVSKRIKVFNQVEESGSNITYRCLKCRNCQDCRIHEETEATSIKEEVEQDIINRSINVNTEVRITTAKLPFIHDPKLKLAPNKDKATKVFMQQLRKLNKNNEDKTAVIKSEGKLQALGHVDFVSNLSEDQQKKLSNDVIQNFIPWRAVWKENSISTPCRVVFDASQPTSSGYSLNDLLAKGRNNMNKLQEILIRWSMHKEAFHTDVQKMYNSVKLREEDWCFQRYIWQSELDPTKIPVEKVIKTLIYGVRSSGNQAERGLRNVADCSKFEYPEVHQIIHKDIYVDDCISGGKNNDAVKQIADEIELVLIKGGFALKGVTFSGNHPPENLTEDGVSVHVAGLKWYSKDDVLSLNINELNFTKRIRGRKNWSDSTSIIPKNLTRRQCASKVAEVYDLTGKITPIISSMKLDLHDLVKQNIGWDDFIPENLWPIWETNFDTLQSMKYLRFKRAIVPSDAINLNIETIDFGDASQTMACAAIYARFERSNGDFSCQLVLGRSKIIPDNTTQPRAEMIAAVLNTHAGEVVKRAFGDHHTRHLKLSDSEIVLHWLKNEEKSLKTWVHNRVIEVKRFTNIDDWYHISSNNMLADIGTRRGAQISDIDEKSSWINGYEWMEKPISSMPIIPVRQINITKKYNPDVVKEMAISPITSTMVTTSSSIKGNEIHLPLEIKDRYKFSNYLVDPNKYTFQKVLRIMGYVIKFINRIRKPCEIKETLQLMEDEIRNAQMYFYKKATCEVKQFIKPKVYEKISTEKNEVLYYTGRILPCDEVTTVGRLTNTMIDLSSRTFCVPLIDKYSPLAYAIVNDIHWFNKNVKHSGVETTWREILKICYIIEGRDIVKRIRKSCERCRFLNKKTIDICMAPISKHNLTIAPPFYITQIDLAGPFQAFSEHQKRKTIKVWMAVFICCTTSASSIKMMENYNTTSFLQAFIRLSCEVGYPKTLLTDEGSQLVKGCEDMCLDFKDMQNKLFEDSKVDFEVCPVGGHYMHGRVERRIQEIKKSIAKTCHNQRLSILQWETIGAEISNALNDMPLALGNLTSDFEAMDLITPNRLKIGRNNSRSPVGTLKVDSTPSKFIELNEKIFNTWFENWLLCHVPKLMHQPKWFKTSHHLKIGDIVLMLKLDSTLCTKYQFGRITKVFVGKDGLIRKAMVEFKNHSEKVYRQSCRSVRELVVIHSTEDIDLSFELSELANN